MAVRIVAGLAGSGKSLRCFERIVAALRAKPLGPPIYWIVPRQATFSAERWLTCSSGLGAFSRCRVVSFDNLAKEVLDACGGSKRPVLTQPARLALIGHLLRRHAGELRHFRLSARHPGLAAELMTLLDELGRNGSADAVDRVLPTLDPASTLARKLADLQTLRRAYTEFLGPTGRFDKDSRMEHVLRNVLRCDRFRGATVYVDGFLDLLDFERRMIVTLAQVAAELEVSFCIPTNSPSFRPPALAGIDDESVFHRVETAHRALRLALDAARIPVVDERLELGRRGSRLLSPGLRTVERVLSGDAARPTAGDTPDVRFIEAPDPAAEVDAVAREIMRLTAAGHRYRDIIVLVRSLPPYAAHIRRSFTEHSLRFFMDHRRDASCHPLIRLVRSVLAIASEGGWSTEHVAAICKSGLVRQPDGTETPHALACRLENLAVSRGWRGEAWTVRHPHIDPEIESLRATVIDALAPAVAELRGQPEAATTARAACASLLALLEKLGVRSVLAHWAKQATELADHEARDEHVQVWKEVTALFDDLGDLLGDLPVSAADLQTIVLSAMEGLDLALTPPTVDEVIVGPAERTRPGDARVVFVLGFSDSIFPLRDSGDSLLTDGEREALRDHQVQVDCASDRRQLDERLIGYLACTRASQRLYLSRPTLDARGSPLPPGSFWTALREALPDTPVAKAAPETRFSPADIATPRQLAVSLLRWARDPSLRKDPRWRGLYNRLANAPLDGSPLDLARHAVWAALSRGNRAALRPDTARLLFPPEREFTDDQLETFAACPFQHFVRYVLRPEAVTEPEITAAQLSGVLHAALDRLCRKIVSAGATWPASDDAAVAALLSRLAREVIDEQVGRMTWDGSTDPGRLKPRDRYLLDRVRTLLSDVVKAHQVAQQQTAFVPRHAALTFGGDSPAAPPLTVDLTIAGKPAQPPALIRGRIDRVDQTPDGKWSIAWDYRWHRVDMLGDMYHGLAMGVLVHLLALRDCFSTVTGVATGQVAGAVVLGLAVKPETFKTLDQLEAAHPVSAPEFFLARRRGEGLLHRDALSTLDTATTTGKSELYNYRLKKDGNPDARSTGVLTPAQFDALLAHAQATIADLARHIRAGLVSVRPYRLGNATPCPRCDYRPVCRFDPRGSGDGCTYQNLLPLKPAQVLATLVPPAAAPAEAAPPTKPPRRAK